MPHLAPVLAGWRSGANFDANLTVNNAAAASKTPQRLSRVVERQREPSNEETHGAKLRRQPPVHVDPDQQDSTGYVPGAPRLALGGHSTFLIDNSQGGGDALVRLYRNGTKPAVRSLFVKQGERFTATDLRSGSYVMRYRYMGSTTTYEADQVFELKQVSELDGIRFSNIRVTLFAVRDGNMKTKQVAPDDF